MWTSVLKGLKIMWSLEVAGPSISAIQQHCYAYTPRITLMLQQISATVHQCYSATVVLYNITTVTEHQCYNASSGVAKGGPGRAHAYPTFSPAFLNAIYPVIETVQDRYTLIKQSKTLLEQSTIEMSTKVPISCTFPTPGNFDNFLDFSWCSIR